MIEALEVPQTRHAVIVHAPVVLSMLAALVALLAAICRKNLTLRWGAAAVFAALLGSAFLATNSGEDAEHSMGQISTKAHRMVHEHEELAETVWIFSAIGLGLTGLAFLKKPKGVGVMSAWGATAVGIASAGWVANTAHHGGKLVYSFGVGTPNPEIDEPPIPQSALDAITDPRARFFLTDVRPVFMDRCVGCHSGLEPEHGLDVTSIASLMHLDMDYGRAIVPGAPERSVMMKVINWDSGYEEKMPPRGDALQPEQIAAIEQWIRDGAVWLDPPTE